MDLKITIKNICVLLRGFSYQKEKSKHNGIHIYMNNIHNCLSDQCLPLNKNV